MKYHCGQQHHLIMQGRFHLATFIDDLLVSTVGDCHSSSGKRQTLGAGDDYYETYVFRTDDDWSAKADDSDPYTHPDVIEWTELWGERWKTAEQANLEHARIVAAIESGKFGKQGKHEKGTGQ